MAGKTIRFAALVCLAVLYSPSLVGHDLPSNTIMNAFVKIDHTQAHLVVRVPLDLLRRAAFPMQGSQYDQAAAAPAIHEAISALAEGFVFLEDGTRLVPSESCGRLSPASDHSFVAYDVAVTLACRPPDLSVGIFYDLGYLDIHFTYPISSPKSVFKLQSLVAADLGNITRMTIRYLPLNESSRALIITGGSDPVALNPAWYQAASGFVTLGIEHILTGYDHLLFLFCLIIPYRRFRGLLSVITAFTVAHSITLIGTAYGLAPAGAWFPPFVETAIAMSIVYMALENIVGADLRHRWLITGIFGLVHGFGFSYALRDNLQFAGKHLLVSLLSFNIGIELGQLAVLTVMLGALWLLFRAKKLAGRTGIIVLSAVVAHTAWHWMVDRAQTLWQTGLPSFDSKSLVMLARWAAALLIAAGAASLFGKWRAGKSASPGEPAAIPIDSQIDEPAATLQAG